MDSLYAAVSTRLATIPCLVAKRTILCVRRDKKSQSLPKIATLILIIDFDIIRNQLILRNRSPILWPAYSRIPCSDLLIRQNSVSKDIEQCPSHVPGCQESPLRMGLLGEIESYIAGCQL